VLLELAVTVRLWISLLAPELIPERLTGLQPGVFIDREVGQGVERRRLVDRIDSDQKGTGNELLLAPPSLTVTVMVALP